MLLYHGTLKDYLPSIQSSGLRKGVGWGGHGSEGVFLATSKEGAMYWAKIGAVHAHNEASEESLDDDESVEDMQTELLEAVQIPAPAAPGQVSPFSGRCFPLDDA